MNNKYSIIIPVYNTEKYLNKCIDSVLNQTYSNIEIIIINDGSTDKSLELCNQYKDQRIKLFTHENRGVSYTRNIGIDNATGEYIIFVDSDDYIENNAIELINEKIQNSDLDLIQFAFSTFEAEEMPIAKNVFTEKVISDSINEKINYMIEREVINSIWNKCYNTNILNKNSIRFAEDIKIGEDLIFNLEYFSYISNFDILNVNLYNYRLNVANSLTKKYNENKYVMLMKVNDILEKFANKYNDDKIIATAKYIKFKSICSCTFDLFNLECKYTKLHKLKIINEFKTNVIKIKTNRKIFKILNFIYLNMNARIIYLVFKFMYKFK